MSNLLDHARHELTLLMGDDPHDEMQREMNSHILKMVEIFANEDHSGFSASYAVGVLEKLLRFEPLTPLTGEDDEWVEVADNLFQNVRCSHVFKGKDGAYDIDGIIFKDTDGCCYTNYNSRVQVTFPYVPKSKVVSIEQ